MFLSQSDFRTVRSVALRSRRRGRSQSRNSCNTNYSRAQVKRRNTLRATRTRYGHMIQIVDRRSWQPRRIIPQSRRKRSTSRHRNSFSLECTCTPRPLPSVNSVSLYNFSRLTECNLRHVRRRGGIRKTSRSERNGTSRIILRLGITSGRRLQSRSHLAKGRRQ